MAAGIPLDDTTRAPWLAALADELAQAGANNESVVLACSALKAAYRDQLRAGSPILRLLWLRADAGLLAARLEQRRGHFMPARLLDSQFADLEPPDDAIILDAALPPDRLAVAALRQLGM
jgi:gluconokinase